MMNTMKLPVGIDDFFRKLRESDFYYVDKTRLIGQITKLERGDFFYSNRAALEKLSI